MSHNGSHYVRNFVFGVEDSLVSTVGLLSGIAVTGLPKTQIFLTGIVLIFVEAFSMGVGSYLSESTVEDSERKHESVLTIEGALIMFFSYFASGFIPLSPYMFIENNITGLIVSIIFSLVALFLLGVVSGRLTGSKNVWRKGLKMFLIGGTTVLIGTIVGLLVDA